MAAGAASAETEESCSKINEDEIIINKEDRPSVCVCDDGCAGTYVTYHNVSVADDTCHAVVQRGT